MAGESKIGNLFNTAVSTYGTQKGWSLRLHPEDATLLITLPPADGAYPQLAMSVLKGEHAWLEQGIAAYGTEMGLGSRADDSEDLTSFDRELLAVP